MSKYYSGMDGKLLYAEGAGTPAEVIKVRDWQITLQTDALETSVLSEWERSYTTGMRSATGSATVLYYGDAPVKLIEQVMQVDRPLMDKTCKLKLAWDTKFFEFEAVITNAAMGSTVGEVMSVAIQFQKTGPFTGTAL